MEKEKQYKVIKSWITSRTFYVLAQSPSEAEDKVRWGGVEPEEENEEEYQYDVEEVE